MSVDQKDFLKRNFISMSTFVVLIGFIVQQSKWQQNVDNRLLNLEHHSINKEMHMPFKDKIEIFVPRVEINGRLENIDKSLDEIKADIKKSLNQ